MFDILEADIVVMQEAKIQRKDLQDDMVLVRGWDCYFSLPKHKKGTWSCCERSCVVADPLQDTRGLSSIRGNRSALRLGLRRVLLAFCVLQALLQATTNFLRSSR